MGFRVDEPGRADGTLKAGTAPSSGLNDTYINTYIHTYIYIYIYIYTWEGGRDVEGGDRAQLGVERVVC